MPINFSETAAYIWNLADLLRWKFKESQYRWIILPFTVLCRSWRMFEATKPKVSTELEKRAGLPKDAREVLEQSRGAPVLQYVAHGSFNAWRFRH